MHRAMAVNVVSGDGNRFTQPPERPLFVREAQRALRDLGYDPGPIDGTFGSQTRTALEKYQLAERLPVTGELDAPTIERLDVYRRLFRPAREF
jgi:peptidoglycan hydrolase-like protein with peptidoglycan-binding domain